MRILFLLLVGCTTVHHLAADTPLTAINEMLRDRGATVSYTDGRSTTAHGVEMGRDALYVDENGTRRRVPLEAVQSVGWRSPGRGALEGIAFGLPSGAALGAIIGFASGDDNCNGKPLGCAGFTAGFKASVLAAGFGIVGTLAGFIIGASIGHHDELIVPTPSLP